jgi:hypothetical protein
MRDMYYRPDYLKQLSIWSIFNGTEQSWALLINKNTADIRYKLLWKHNTAQRWK